MLAMRGRVPIGALTTGAAVSASLGSHAAVKMQ